MIRNELMVALVVATVLFELFPLTRGEDEDMYDSETDSNGDGIPDIIEEIYEEMDPKNLDPGLFQCYHHQRLNLKLRFQTGFG